MKATFQLPNRSKDGIVILLLILFTGISRLLFSEKDIPGFSFDSGSFVLAAKSYSVQETRPHLPGYYLHVQSIRGLARLTGDLHSAMVFLSILYSSLAMGFLYALLRRWLSRKLALLLCLITLTNPFVWFYGCISEIYAFDLFFSTGMIWLGLSGRWIYALPVFIALGTGVRPSSGVLLFPLYIFLWYRHCKEARISWYGFGTSHLLAAMAGLSWLVPMTRSTGGVASYLTLYRTQNPIEPIGFLQNGFRLSSYLVFIAIPFFILAGIGLFQRLQRSNENRTQLPFVEEKKSPEFRGIVIFWTLPALLFFVFFHYSKGYFMICAAGLFISILNFIPGKVRRTPILTVIIGLQSLFFMAMPYTLPDVQVYFSPQVRSLNIARVLWQRTRSLYLMAQSRIRATEKFFRKVEVMAIRIGQPDEQSFPVRKYVFLDPTCPVSVRTLQAKYPEVSFVVISLFEADVYGVYIGLKQESHHDVAKMLSEAVIISRRAFVEDYLNDFDLQEMTKGDLTLFTVPSDEYGRLAQRYQSLFVR